VADAGRLCCSYFAEIFSLSAREATKAVGEIRSCDADTWVTQSGAPSFLTERDENIRGREERYRDACAVDAAGAFRNRGRSADHTLASENQKFLYWAHTFR
jgi:hypothetical protein